MVCRAAVGIDDDFASGEAAVADRPADDEFAGGVDVVAGFAGEPFFGQYFVDDEFAYCFFEVVQADVFVVLGGEDDGVYAGDFAVFIEEGDLAFGVRAQPRQYAFFTYLRLALDETVRVGDGRGHEAWRFRAGVAEHEALVAGALRAFFRTVHALRDVGGLFADGVDDGAG